MKLNNPVIALVDWIEKQGLDVAAEIAIAMAAQHPSFDIYSMSLEDKDKLVENFLRRTKEFSGTEIGNPGFLVAFRAIFDFAIVNRRGTKENWDEAQEFMKEMAEECSTVKAMADQLPVRSEAWIKICQNWKTFKESELSDENIERWADYNMLERSKEIMKPITIKL